MEKNPYGKEKRPGVGVGVLIKKDNKILLQKRKGSYGEGTWSLPGGHLEFNETLEECVKREVLEEVNINVKNISFLCITNDIMNPYNKHYITVFFEAIYDSGELKINEPHRAESIEWFNANDLPEPLFLPLQNLVDEKSYPQVKL